VRASTILMKGLATILLPALLATPALAATVGALKLGVFRLNLQLAQGELGRDSDPSPVSAFHPWCR
jgi:hypothetical protein